MEFLFSLKEFQRTVLENVSRKVQGVAMDSQNLIQSAAPGVDTSGLEADQESLMDKWNSLNAKVILLSLMYDHFYSHHYPHLDHPHIVDIGSDNDSLCT